MANRRSFLQSALGIATGLFASKELVAEVPVDAAERLKRSRMRGATVSAHVPVVTTDVGDLPFAMDGDVKVFHLIAQVMMQQIAPGKKIAVWGFNGSAPGPTIQVNEGDRVRVIFDNELPEPTSMHWHGFEDQIQFDGQPAISQPAVMPGGRFVYEFHIRQNGTYFYHSHMAMQEMAGMLGAFIMHPKEAYAPHCDKDFAISLQEYAVLPSNTVPNTMNMEYNWLLLNGKAGPASTPVIVRLGDRVRIRLVNLGMDHHPMHMHGHTFYVTGTEGGRIPQSAWWPGNTVLVGVAQARNIEFVANNPGDWMLHCHLPHHMMNQMSSNVGNTATTNGPMSDAAMEKAMPGMAGMTMGDAPKDVAANANDVPNFPQDAYMEGPMMQMDAMVDKPENYGLAAGWSQYMQGMMTFVRVLPPEKYDEVTARMRKANRPRDPYQSLLDRA